MEPGKKADLVVVPGNPLANLKLLYPTHPSLEAEGQRLTIKDGIIFDSRELLQRVRASVADETAARATGSTQR